VPSFESYGPWAGLALKAVAASLGAIRNLGAAGRKVVEQRAGDYREWDPEIIAVDRGAEEEILRCIRDSGFGGTIISEEAGVVPLEGGSERAYFIVDPFDGSMLFRRGIPAFWYTCLGIYGEDGEPRAAAVGDAVCGYVEFCDEKGAYRGRLAGGEVQEVETLQTCGAQDLSEAYIETYLMKPQWMYPACRQFEPLFKKVKMILPNGGPAGFADVAAGRVDAYLAINEAAVEVFNGLPIALRAGCVVTDYSGMPVAFSDDIERQYSLVCSANRSLHEQILAQISSLRLP